MAWGDHFDRHLHFDVAKSDFIGNFVSVGNKVVFKAHVPLPEPDEFNNTHGYKFAITDGTTNGTSEITELNNILGGNPTPLFADGDILYSHANIDENGTTDIGRQMLAYNIQSSEVTILSRELDADGGTGSHAPHSMVKFTDGWVYYVGSRYFNDVQKQCLFRTNGTSIELVDNTITDASNLTVFNGKIYMSASTEATGKELFVFDPNGEPTSIEENKKMSAINVSPNPSYGYVNVKGIKTPKATYEIYSLTGSMVEKGIISNNQIDYNVRPGMYLLKITEDTVVKTQKIIVK